MSQGGVTEVCVGVSFGLISGFTALKPHECLKTEKVSNLKVKQSKKTESMKMSHLHLTSDI